MKQTLLRIQREDGSLDKGLSDVEDQQNIFLLLSKLQSYLLHGLEKPLIHPKTLNSLRFFVKKKRLDYVRRIIHSLPLTHQAIIYRLLKLLLNRSTSDVFYSLMNEWIFRLSTVYNKCPSRSSIESSKVLTYLIAHQSELFAVSTTEECNESMNEIRGFDNLTRFYINELDLYDNPTCRGGQFLFGNLENSLMSIKDLSIISAGSKEIRLEAGHLLAESPIQSILLIRHGNLVVSNGFQEVSVFNNQTIEEPSVFSMQPPIKRPLKISVRDSSAALISIIEPEYLTSLTRVYPEVVARFFFEMSYKLALRCDELINSLNDAKLLAEQYNLCVDEDVYTRLETNDASSKTAKDINSYKKSFTFAHYACEIEKKSKFVKGFMSVSNNTILFKSLGSVGSRYTKNISFDDIEDISLLKDEMMTITLISNVKYCITMNASYFDEAYNLIFKLWKSKRVEISLKKDLFLGRKQISLPFSELKLSDQDLKLIIDESSSRLVISEGETIEIKPSTLHLVTKGKVCYELNGKHLLTDGVGAVVGSIEYFTGENTQNLLIKAEEDCLLRELNMDYLNDLLFPSDYVLATKFNFLTVSTISKIMYKLHNNKA